MADRGGPLLLKSLLVGYGNNMNDYHLQVAFIVTFLILWC